MKNGVVGSARKTFGPNALSRDVSHRSEGPTGLQNTLLGTRPRFTGKHDTNKRSPTIGFVDRDGAAVLGRRPDAQSQVPDPIPASNVPQSTGRNDRTPTPDPPPECQVPHHLRSIPTILDPPVAFRRVPVRPSDSTSQRCRGRSARHATGPLDLRRRTTEW